MKPIGIMGGLGPEASNKFCDLLIRNKEAQTDQDNIDFIHYCNTKIPNRIDYIAGKTSVSPIPEMVRTCKALESIGVSCIVVPCNTVHCILPEVQKEISTPIIDIIQLLVKKIKLENPYITKIGVLGTTLTVNLQLYERYLNLVGIEVVKLDEESQENLVMQSIYNIKAGKKRVPKQFLTQAANEMIQKGAEALIFGCTEIPLVLSKKDFDVPCYEPMLNCAKEIIRYSKISDVEKLLNSTISVDNGIFASVQVGNSENLAKQSEDVYITFSKDESVLNKSRQVVA